MTFLKFGNSKNLIKKIIKKKIFRKYKKEKDFWNKYKYFRLKSSSNEFSFDKYSFKKRDLIVKINKVDNIFWLWTLIFYIYFKIKQKLVYRLNFNLYTNQYFIQTSIAKLRNLGLAELDFSNLCLEKNKPQILISLSYANMGLVTETNKYTY